VGSVARPAQPGELGAHEARVEQAGPARGHQASVEAVRADGFAR